MLGLKALLRRVAGKPIPGDNGDKFMSKSYIASEAGPTALSGKGETEMEKTREKLMAEDGRVECPFSNW